MLKRSDSDEETVSAKKEIMRTGAVPAILEKMRAEQFRDGLNRFYTNKYKGLVWQLIILAELSADGDNGEIKEYCEYILSHSVESESGGFSTETSARTGTGLRCSVIPCLTGNMIFSLIRLGFLHDARVQRAINWLALTQLYDDGDGNAKGWPYDRFEMCFGKHTCHMGAVKTLKAFAEIPENMQTPEVKASLQNGAEYILKHHIFKKSHELSKDSKPGWKKFSFPLMYQTDALDILLILQKLGVRDSRMDEAISLVESKRNMRGRWDNTAPLAGKFLIESELKGESKWVTIRALTALKVAGKV